MSTRRNALGRGLEALIPSSGAGLPPAAPDRNELPAAGSGPAEIRVDQIDPNPEQPRRHFDPQEIARLAASIRRHGVLQPVVVRRAGERFELVVGERRWRASREAGRETVPAVVADVEPRERLQLALIENVQRRDLNPMELAHAFRSMADTGSTQDEIGEQVGLDRSTVANHLRMLDLARELQEDVESGRLTVGHAKALLQIQNPERRRHMRNRIVKDGLSVRASEELGRRIAGPGATRSKRTRPVADPELRSLVESLRRRFQTQVRLQGDGARGRIEIDYFGAEDLQRIVGMLRGDA